MPLSHEVMINVVHNARTAACGWGAAFLLGLLALVQAQGGQITVQPAGNQGFDVYANGVLVAPLQRLAAAWRGRPGPRGSAELTLVHRPAQAEPASQAVAPGVRAMPWQEFVKGLV